MTYEYLCTSCGFDLDIEQKITDPPHVECPNCLEKSLVRQISKGSFLLKGDKWEKKGGY